jgi:hypothetical protein
LKAGLQLILHDCVGHEGELVILDRQHNIYTTTFPSEIVTFRTGSGSGRRLFLKYSAVRDNVAYGHRGGVGYEAKVYRRLLNSLGMPLARSYATNENTGDLYNWLVLDCLDDCARVTSTSDPDSMNKAARWIARFHARCSARVYDPELSFLGRYTPDYFHGWVNRTQHLIKRAGVESRWLQNVCNRFDQVIALLCEPPLTIIHGEYYPQNILLHQGMIYPIDWESTAISSGMIDLAMLTEGWPPDSERELVHEYQRARWADGIPDDFARRLAAARIYVQFRWLGDPLAPPSKRGYYLDALHEHAEAMGLI